MESRQLAWHSEMFPTQWLVAAHFQTLWSQVAFPHQAHCQSEQQAPLHFLEARLAHYRKNDSRHSLVPLRPVQGEPKVGRQTRWSLAVRFRNLDSK